MDKYTLKTAFRKSFLGIVWRIEVDTESGLLAIETRHPASGIPAFSSLDYVRDALLVDEQPYGDRNWAMAGIVEGRIILRAWGQNTPEGSGIACLDARTGAVIWEQFAYTLVAIENRQLLVRHRNVASGYEQRMSPVDGDLTKINNTANKPYAPAIVIPRRHEGDVPDVLISYAPHGPLFTCRVEDRTVWAFHETAERGYLIRLVVSQGPNVLTDRVIVSGLSKMAPELFFMIGHRLFFIGDNKQELVSYLV